MFLDWTLYLLLFTALLGGLFLVVLTLPGLWVMLGAAVLYAAATRLHYVGWKELLFLFVLAAVAEGVETVLGGAGAKKAGGGKLGVVGGIVGGLLGGVFLTFVPVPVVGTVVGIITGSFLGAAALEWAGGKEVPHSVRIGVGAAKGRFIGIVSKVLFGVVMILATLFAAFPRRPALAPRPAAPATAPAVPPVRSA